MSHLVRNLVYAKRVGKTRSTAEGVPHVSASKRKAVLLAMADRANDDGGDIYVSKVRIAAELECDRETVVQATQSLIADGLVLLVGRRPARNGYTDNHKIVIGALQALPDVLEKCRNSDTLDDALTEGDEPLGKFLTPVHKSRSRKRASVGSADSKASENRRQSVGSADTEHPNRTSSNGARYESPHRRADPEYAREGVSGSSPVDPRTRRIELRLVALRKDLATARRGEEIKAGLYEGMLPRLAAEAIADEIAQLEGQLARKDAGA